MMALATGAPNQADARLGCECGSSRWSMSGLPSRPACLCRAWNRRISRPIRCCCRWDRLRLIFGRRLGDDGADGHRVRDGFRHGAVQRDRLFAAAGALVRAGPDPVSLARGLHRHLIYALSRWPGSIAGAGGVPLFSSLLVGVLILSACSSFPADPAPRRPPDLECPSFDRRPGPRRHSRTSRRSPKARRSPVKPPGPQLSESRPDRDPGAAYFGPPRTIARIETDELAKLAQQSGAVIVMLSGVGDTVVDNTPFCGCRAGEAFAKLDSCEPSSSGGNGLRSRIPNSHPSPGRHRDQGAVARNQRPDDGGPGHRPDRGPAARLGGRQLEAGYPGRRRDCPARVADADLGRLSDLAFDEIRIYGVARSRSCAG